MSLLSFTYSTHCICRVLPCAVMIAIPLVTLSYVAVNVAFFSVLSYNEIESAQAVGLVCTVFCIIIEPASPI